MVYNGDDNGLHLYNSSSAGNYSLVWSSKKLTDVPATGLHLMSAKDGTTRNMATNETGFDPNDIVKVEIYG
jgi:hypothetical protein